jgi:hypothetical protein
LFNKSRGFGRGQYNAVEGFGQLGKLPGKSFFPSTIFLVSYLKTLFTTHLFIRREYDKEKNEECQ